MASGTIAKPFVVYHKLLKGTTSTSGNISAGLNKSNYIIIGAATNRTISGYYTSFYNIFPFAVGTTGEWAITAVTPSTSTTTVLAGTAVAIDIWYIDNNSVGVT